LPEKPGMYVYASIRTLGIHAAMKFRILAACASTLSLQACMFAPGQHMSNREISHDTEEGAHYQVVPITPKLIAMEKESHQAYTIPEALLSYQPEAYRIAAGDSLYITVWEHPELTSPAGAQQQTAANGRLVRPDGTLFYPYVGILKAEGLTVEELRAAITDRLTKFIEKPQVDVNVVGYGSQRVTMNGAFTNTTPQPVTVIPLTLGQAIGAAGTNAEIADLSDLVLSRDGQDYHINLDALSQNRDGAKEIYLKGGDRIYMPYSDRHEVYVLGEVTQPRAIPFKTSDMTLTQALGRVGGLLQTTAKGKAVYVIRGVEDMEKAPATIYQLDGSMASSYAVASQFSVHPGDVVFVGPAGITRWNRFISQLLPLSGLVSNAATAENNFVKPN